MKSYDVNQISQRQLRVGEMVKQALSLIFIRGEAKIPNLETNLITVTEVRMTPDLKVAKAFVLPLAGKETKKTIDLLKEFLKIHIINQVKNGATVIQIFDSWAGLLEERDYPNYNECIYNLVFNFFFSK